MEERDLSSEEILDKFASMMGRTLPAHSGKKEEYVGIWPMPVVHIFEADGTVARTFTHILYDYIKTLEKLGYSDREISRLFKRPARIANYIWALKLKEIMQMTKDQRIELYKKLFRYVSFYREDVFCEGEKNLLWPTEKVAKALDKDFLDLSAVENPEHYQKLIGRLNATLWSYTELLFFAPHGFGHEFHGPYLVDDRRTLIVREYYDLDTELWKFSKDLGISTITSLEIYKDAEMGFDFFNRTITDKPLPPYLLKYFVTLDGRALEPENLHELLNRLERVVQKGVSFVGQLSKKGLLKKFVEIHFFTLKLLAEKLEKDWRPPEESYDVIDREEVTRSPILAKKFAILQKMPELSEEGKYKAFKEMFHPGFNPKYNYPRLP